jgi:acetolactate synthase I/II/III large subunit
MGNGAEAVVTALQSEQTEFIFGIPGTQNLPLLDAIRATNSIRFILTRHEQGAGFMCYGYARVSGKPGIVTATEGPGATNLATPIAAAHKGNVPIIALSGAAEPPMHERDSSQDIDQRALFTPITRWSANTPSANKLPEMMQRAFRASLGVPPGPVHIDASRQMLMNEVSSVDAEPASYRSTSVPACSASDIDRAYDLLSRSERPVILTGIEMIEEGVVDDLIRLVEMLGLPVVTNEDHLDAFPSTHAQSLGALGRSAWGPTLSAVREADLVLVVGGRLDSATTQMSFDIIPRDARIVFNTKYVAQVGNVFPVAHASAGSVASFVDGLSERVASSNLRKEWLDTRAVRDAARQWREARQDPNAVPANVPSVTRVARDILDDDAIVCLDAGNATKHVRAHWDTYTPRTFFVSDDWGSVGCAFPMAIGAKLAAPDRQVVAMVGDMGFGCNLAELETCLREDIPVVTVVFNDHGLGNEKAFQRERHGGRYFAVDYAPLDFGAIARSFGAHGELVERCEEFRPALQRSLNAGIPAVIDVRIDPENLAPVVLEFN